MKGAIIGEHAIGLQKKRIFIKTTYPNEIN